MITMLENKRRSIAEICSRHKVKRLDVFGSALNDDFDPKKSDLDLLVEFIQMGSYERVDAYFGLTEDLSSLLGIKIDLVMVDAVKNPYIVRDINSTRQLLYAA